VVVASTCRLFRRKSVGDSRNTCRGWAGPARKGTFPTSLVTFVWGAALLGYLAAGFGVLRVPLVRHLWAPSLILATVASVALLSAVSHPIVLAGIAVDLIVFWAAFAWARGDIETAVARAGAVGVKGLPHPIMHRLGWGTAGLFLVYATAVVLLRPVLLQWGTTSLERTVVLPGDPPIPMARYNIDHGITIRAPADSVWPWLAQIGQDRGGFYSYAWLERAAGDDIRNADCIHPEWQRIERGQLIRAAQADYLGGIFGNEVGWRVTYVEPGRALVLENWGAFVLRPIDDRSTRLIIRTRGEGAPSLLAVVFGPLGVFVFEPAHFIMQQRMMRGIRDRAEQSVTS
jgi:hypothetical protein